MSYEPEYYTVGELAKNYGVPVSTLRFYDKQGIFVPEYRNPENGYRYYSSGQLLILDVILFLREMGVATNRIPEFIQNATSRADLMEALRTHNKEIKERIETLKAISAKIEAVDEKFNSVQFSIGVVETAEFGERVFQTQEAVNLPSEGPDRRFRFRQHMLSRSTAYITPPTMCAMGVIYSLEDLRRGGILTCSHQFMEFAEPERVTKGGKKLVIPAGKFLTIRFCSLPGERVAACNKLLRHVAENGFKTDDMLIEANTSVGMPPVIDAEEMLEFQLRILEL